jgi:hypothetical protein
VQVETTRVFRLNERDTVMLQSCSVQNHVSASEGRDLMLFSVWLLACVLLLEGTSQQLKQRQVQKEE